MTAVTTRKSIIREYVVDNPATYRDITDALAMAVSAPLARSLPMTRRMVDHQAEIEHLNMQIAVVGGIGQHVVDEIERRAELFSEYAKGRPRAVPHPSISARKSVLRDLMEGVFG